MLNKKGFTIAEVLVSFILITIVLSSIVSSTIYYRDRLKEEEVISQLYDFKNNVTKIIYDDILDESKGISRVETCVGTSNCVNFISKDDVSYTLKIVDQPQTVGNKTRGVYLYYDGVEYMLPDSDLGDTDERVCDFIGGIELAEYDNKMYKVKTSFKHKDYDLQYDLLFVIS